MGAVKKFYNEMGTTSPRQTIEFITRARRLGGLGEAGASWSTASIWRTFSNTEVEIDWGDGNADTIELPANTNIAITGQTSSPQRYSYEGGDFDYPVEKVVRVRFLNPQAVTRFEIVRWYVRGNLSTAIDTLTNLQILSITFTLLDEFPANIANLPNLQQLTISSNSSLNKRIPEYIFSITSLQDFTCGSNQMGDLTYEESGITRLKELPNLTRVALSTNGFSEIPPPLFEIPNINHIGFQTQFTTASINPTIPEEAELAVTWKSVDLGGCYRIPEVYDEFIDNLYDFIVANAAMTGSNSLPFRGMSFFISSSSIIPTGLYQQPSGFALGSNNGSPASPYERIWVLVNQYGHTISVANLPVQGITPGSTTVITTNRGIITSANTELRVGSIVRFKDVGGSIGSILNDTDHEVIDISGSTFTIDTDTTGESYTSGGQIYRIAT